MVVGERKPLSEIKEMVRPYGKILIAGCDTCTAECLSGGRKQVAELAAALDMAFRLEGKDMEILEVSVDRQCIQDFLLDIIDKAEGADAVLSIACGAGIQSLAERLPGKAVLPGLNTMFIGESSGTGLWQERCQGCGDCVLGTTGGLCPVTRCAKGLLNGPCGGSQGGKCEVSHDPEMRRALRLGHDLRPPERVGRTGSPHRLLRPQRLAPRRRQRPPAVGAPGSLRASENLDRLTMKGRQTTGLFLWVECLGPWSEDEAPGYQKIMWRTVEICNRVI